MPARRAFTLVELLIVIAIIVVLIALLIPTLNFARANTRRTVCASNLRQLGIATNLYLDANDGYFWRYYWDIPGAAPGRLWWFGFEANGPAAAGTRNRSLDKSRSVLGPYTANLANLLQCPDFPYDDAEYFPKFNKHAASYGYNIKFLGPVAGETATRTRYSARQDSVFVFTDAVQFDFGATFNEGHYVLYTPGASSPSGYAQFRHRNAGAWTAQMSFIDGHVESQPFQAPGFKPIQGMPCGNLHAIDGSNTIYGY